MHLRRAVEGDVPLLLVVGRLIPHRLALHPPLEPHHHPVHLLGGAEEEEAAAQAAFERKVELKRQATKQSS